MSLHGDGTLGVDLGRNWEDALVSSHLINPSLLRQDAFDDFFLDRMARLCTLIETAMAKTVQRDLTAGAPTEDSSHFEAETLLDDHNDGEA